MKELGQSAVSFRDPAGTLFTLDGRILRFVTSEASEECTELLSVGRIKQLINEGKIIHSRVVDEREARELLKRAGFRLRSEPQPAPVLLLEHEPIWFPTYPYEWSPEMLWQAGRLTLDLATTLLETGFGLKDGTPYNVLYRGPEPVFVDLLSFEKREPQDPTWLAYSQFVRTFMFPLLMVREFGFSLDQSLLCRRDGPEPAEVYRLLSTAQRLMPPFFSLVSMPKWLEKTHNPDETTIYARRLLENADKAQFIFSSTLRRLSRTLDRLEPPENRTSSWSDYVDSNNNYSSEHIQRKKTFVRRILSETSPRRVLDVGCNTGDFSLFAADAGSEVVAIDYDPVVVGHLWRRARAAGKNVLPLVVDLSRPTPSVGWRNEESKSFLDRAEGQFDMILLLAVVHHLLVTERVPLNEIFKQLDRLTSHAAIVEFVGPEDSMFRRLTRGRDALHQDLTQTSFEAAARERFEIADREHMSGTHRWIYLLIKKQ